MYELYVNNCTSLTCIEVEDVNQAIANLTAGFTTKYWVGSNVNASVFSLSCSLPSTQALEGRPLYLSPPQLNDAEILALSSQAGDLVYNLTLDCLQVYNGTSWNCL